MRIKHTLTWLAALVALASLGTSVRAQAYTPFAPIDYVEDGQAFEPFDYHNYDDPSPARQGWFFNMDRVCTWISRPKIAAIGEVEITPPEVASGLGTRVEFNSHDTGLLTADDAWANRYEFGFWDDRNGWLLGVFDGGNQDQLINLRDLEVVFNDDPANTPFAGGPGLLWGFIDSDNNGIDDDLNGVGNFGRFSGAGIRQQFQAWDFGDTRRFPVVFSSAQVRNLAYMDGAELMKGYRLARLHNGGVLEVYGGVRYFRFRDRFRVRGQGGALGSSEIHNLVDNNIVGPQVTVRAFHQQNRWQLSAEGKFMAGFNFQSYRLSGFLGSDLDAQGIGLTRGANVPAFLVAQSFGDTFHANEFAPTAELRLNASYKVTQDIALKFGYTALYTYGVSRASNTIDYKIAKMAILEDETRQSLFTNMVNVGFEWNR